MMFKNIPLIFVMSIYLLILTSCTQVTTIGNDELTLGFLYIEQGKLEEAEAMFKKSLKINPNNEWAHNGLGILYRNQSKLQESEYMFQKALEINPNYEWPFIIG